MVAAILIDLYPGMNGIMNRNMVVHKDQQIIAARREGPWQRSVQQHLDCVGVSWRLAAVRELQAEWYSDGGAI